MSNRDVTDRMQIDQQVMPLRQTVLMKGQHKLKKGDKKKKAKLPLICHMGTVYYYTNRMPQLPTMLHPPKTCSLKRILDVCLLLCFGLFFLLLILYYQSSHSLFDTSYDTEDTTNIIVFFLTYTL